MKSVHSCKVIPDDKVWDKQVRNKQETTVIVKFKQLRAGSQETHYNEFGSMK